MTTYYRFDSLEQMDQLVKKYGKDYFGYVPPRSYMSACSGFLIKDGFSWRSGTIESLKNVYPEAYIITFEEAMKNNFKKGDKVVCVDTTDALNDKLVLGEIYTVSYVWGWGNIDVQNNHGETLHNYKPWRFKSLEIVSYITIRADEYEDIKAENEALKSRINTLQEDLVFQDKMIKRFVDAGQIFQVDGKYHKEANLPLGSSCVVEGIKWMDKEIERLKKEIKRMDQEMRELLYQNNGVSFVNKSLQNRLDKIKELC